VKGAENYPHTKAEPLIWGGNVRVFEYWKKEKGMDFGIGEGDRESRS